MILKKYFILGLFLTVSAVGIEAQELLNLPGSTKWRQVKSEHFKVIYPAGLEHEAQRTTNILENIYEPASRSLDASPLRFPIILQNQHAVSNGFVTVAPYRSELYMFEPQGYRSQGNDRWLERLTVHEYRHIVQFEKAITPINKVLYFFMGEFGPFLSAAAAAPQWFYEGDAVGVETSFGHTGRGRMPSFLMSFKANLIDKGGFNYYKQYLKSYRELVPNHYVTGYLMTTYLKNKSGVDVWGKIVGRSFSKPYLPFIFSNSMKKETGKRLVPTYNEMLDQQKQLYTQQLSQIEPTAFSQLPHEAKKNFTNYYFPRRVYNNQVLVVKTGFSLIPALVLIDESGNETKVHELGSWQNPDGLSSNDSSVVWAELELDPRWQRRTYSVVKKLDLRTRKLTRLSSKSKYMAPTISNNGKWVATIQQSDLGQYEIHLLDAHTGELIRAFENPNNDYYSVPQFDSKDENLILLKYMLDGKAILKKNITTGLEEILYYSDKENLGNPILQDGWVYYATDRDGIDNIYAMNMETKDHYQVTSSRFGAFSPRASQAGEILYNDYTSEGFEMAAVSVNPSLWIKAENVKYVGFDFQKQMVQEEHADEILYNYPDSVYETSKYPKVGRILRPHSWGLNTITSNNNYSFGVTSKDLLQTTTLSAIGIFNGNERVWRFVTGGSYQGFYPIIDANYSFGARTLDVLVQDGDRTYTRTYSWNETKVTAGLRLPLYFTNSKYVRKAEFEIKTQHTTVNNYDIPFTSPELTHVRNGKLISMQYVASYQRLLKKSYLDLNSRWGQTLELNYRQTPFGGDYQSELFSAESSLYFPGLFDHHSVQLNGAFQYEDNSEYRFSSPIRYTRGFSYISFDSFVNLSFNYKMPLFYMDWHLGPVFNLRRVYVNGFYDYGIGRGRTDGDLDLKSYGAEVSFNFNLFRTLPLIDMGFRYSRLPDRKDQVFEIIFGGISF
ncbi:MAG: hypothetical protein ABJF11_09850 [Reichenbachiella sp.]|uniref:hypothetical protein n=1 Tax=Reichenbachiella sp. TaxID=2184521 RepID=UPI0032647AAB